MSAITARAIMASPLTATPITARPLGSGGSVDPVKKYYAADGTPPSLVIDLHRGFYYWSGAQKAISDLTVVSGKGYYLDDISWFNSSAFTVAAEYEVPLSGFVSGQHVMSMAIPASGAVRFGVYLDAAVAPVLGIDTPIAAFTTAKCPIAGTLPRFGRSRFMARCNNGATYKIIEDGMVADNTTNTAVYDTTAFTRLAIGYRQIAGTQDSVLPTGDSVCVVAWSSALSDSVMNATAKKSYDSVSPIHILGDSIVNEDTYTNGGGVTSRIKKLAVNDGYSAWSHSIVGGTNLEQFYTRYAADTEHHDSSLIIFEGGLDWDGVDAVGALQDIVGDLNSQKWFFVEPIVSTSMATGSAGRIGYDAELSAIVGWAGESRIIRTLDGLQAENNGSPQDLTDLANDTIPTSLTTDGLHLNATGMQVMAQIIYDALKSANWY